MKVYDCDNEEQFSKLTAIVENLDYIKLNLIQSFSPDTIDEAKNTLLVHKPKYHEWQLPSRTKNDNKEVWDIHHGII